MNHYCLNINNKSTVGNTDRHEQTKICRFNLYLQTLSFLRDNYRDVTILSKFSFLKGKYGDFYWSTDLDLVGDLVLLNVTFPYFFKPKVHLNYQCCSSCFNRYCGCISIIRTCVQRVFGGPINNSVKNVVFHLQM